VTASAEDKPLSLGERLTAAALTAAGLALSTSLDVYDAGRWPARVGLTVVSALAGTLILWVGLGALEAPGGRRLAGAVWAALPWNTLMLSQLPYLGFFFIPLEIVASAAILRFRARVSRPWASLVLATVARILTLGLVYAVRLTLGHLLARR
jgi:hypothetical protein